MRWWKHGGPHTSSHHAAHLHACAFMCLVCGPHWCTSLVWVGVLISATRKQRCRDVRVGSGTKWRPCVGRLPDRHCRNSVKAPVGRHQPCSHRHEGEHKRMKGNAGTPVGPVTGCSETITLCGGLFSLQRRLEWMTPPSSRTLARHPAVIKGWIPQASGV